MTRSVCSAAVLLLLGGAAWAGGGGGKLKPVAGQPAGQQPAAAVPRPEGKPRVAAPTAVRPETSGELVFGTPINYQNLTLVPVGTTKQGPFQKYTLLEQGLDDKTLEVRELRGHHNDAQVNAVEVRNSGNNPVYLLGGEAILGGKQDRIIQYDTVLPNNHRFTRVAVFCVEAGRWAGQNMKFQAGKALAHVALRQAALSGGQSQVWAEVASKNRQQGTSNRTDTYRRTIQNEKVRAKVAPYRAELAKALPRELRLAGMLMAINGRIRVADIFGNPTLFGDVRDKLLSAYILEALGQQVVPNAPRISAGAAKGFIEEGRKAKGVTIGKGGRSIIYKKQTKKLIGAETVDEGNGEKVRESYMAQ
jgi:hypothetical protein